MCANKQHVTYDFNKMDFPKGDEVKSRLNIDASCRNIMKDLDISGVTE